MMLEIGFRKTLSKKTVAGDKIHSFLHILFMSSSLILFFIKEIPNQKFKVGALMIDVFTKYMVVVPIKSRHEDEVAVGINKRTQKKCMENLNFCILMIRQPSVVHPFKNN